MRLITGEFAGKLRTMLPATWRILVDSNLTVHDAVFGVVLTGSRGPKGGHRPDSDIDLSLLVDPQGPLCPGEAEALLAEIVEVTLSNWKSPFELDTAAAFDKSGCGLHCFQSATYTELRCSLDRPDCLGLSKTQKGFHGFVPDIGLRIENVYPMMRIWNREAS